ncbi:alpha-ketoacid dehydrogenase subunit beta [Deinococcus maricopensis]|uniref:Pyruvate dehydrogenase (Acetyl-transferring) n=1 Tax=Deinococcus maricopensis (strain DSM 21211 / LMG 22137 / NRRL B-23946 / LB-34) TaxID=709986 RepID=E8U6R1_DEIML|nr:alpha-ketoacid dehydrogenase subunit beta [Deinococcus maricopensis]ADV66750.1 Pyruvate dehydrogenase (acetyl-transferring) [Deinococcus maricopensis DSM 21211]
MTAAPPTKPATRTMTMVAAINDALAIALERDPAVHVFGEDVGVMGGVFRATDGLQARFGAQRVFDTPLAEAGIVGMGVGMGLAGLRPVAEIQFAGFLYPALDQVLSHVGRYRHRTRGRYHVPMVVRAPYGGGVHTPEQHADSPEAILAHVPGVKVVIPSTPTDAKGLLLAAIEDPDPVFFFEAIKLYRSTKEEVPEGHYTIPLGKARVVTEGDDVTVITYGGMVDVSRKAADAARAHGIGVEVIDLRTITPLDTETVLASVRKTGRAVVVTEAPRTGGYHSEIAAVIAEEAIDALLAPVVRVTGFDAPYPPFTSIEDTYRPNPARVARAIKQVMAY